jgi:hypothetical protein
MNLNLILFDMAASLDLLSHYTYNGIESLIKGKYELRDFTMIHQIQRNCTSELRLVDNQTTTDIQK